MRKDPRLEQDAQDFNTLAVFLARRGVPRLEGSHFDLLVLAGNSVVESAKIAAAAHKSGVVPEILVCGGVGHSTPFVREEASHLLGRDVESHTEAEMLAEILIVHGTPRESLLLETMSANCGANAAESRRMLARMGKWPTKVLIMQDPTMQLRTHASFRKVWDDSPDVRFTSFASFVPTVEVRGQELVLANEGIAGVWPFERFAGLVLGEIPRLRNDARGYGPRGRGFIGIVDIPVAVEEAHARLLARYSPR